MQDVGEALRLSLAGSSGGAIAAIENERKDRESKAAAAAGLISPMPFH
jgi:hypothetical protein